MLETVADSRWHVDQFLAPTPVRTVIDLRGNDHTATRDATALAADFIDGTIQRFLARPGFNAALLKTLLATATERAEALVDLQKKVSMLLGIALPERDERL